MIHIEEASYYRNVKSEERPLLVLCKTTWDDYGEKITYKGWLWTDLTTHVGLGDVKVLVVDDSLGVAAEGNVIAALQDPCAIDKLAKLGVLEDFLVRIGHVRSYDVNFSRNLFRFSSALSVLDKIQKINEVPTPRRDLIIKIEKSLKGFSDTVHTIEIKLDLEMCNLAVVTGPNGIGKTQIMREIALRASGLDGNGGSDFRGVVVVSCTPFDEYPFSSTLGGGTFRALQYIGIKNIFDEKEGVSALKGILDRLRSRPERFDLWKRFWSKVYLKDKALERVGECFDDYKFLAEIKNASAGHRLVVVSTMGVYSYLEGGGVLIMDEPESHLHPQLASLFWASVRELVDEIKAFAVVSTHSPFLIQETPAKMVYIFVEQEGRIVAENYAGQSMGSNISFIAQKVFSREFADEGWISVLECWVRRFGFSHVRKVLGDEGNWSFGLMNKVKRSGWLND